MKKILKSIIYCILIILSFLLFIGCNKSYQISFETNGGGDIDSIVYSTKEELELPDPSKDGFRFDGWYTDEGLIDIIDIDNIKGNLTLYAKWTLLMVVEADSAVGRVEETKTLDDFIIAYIRVLELDDEESAKTPLQNRLFSFVVAQSHSSFSNVITPINYFIKAQKTELQVDINYAKNSINDLGFASSSINYMLDKLDSIEYTNQLNELNNAVNIVKESKDREDAEAVQSLLSDFPEGYDKTNIINIFNDILKLIEAIEATNQAVNTSTLEDYGLALDLVNNLIDSIDKESLSIILEEVKNQIDIDCLILAAIKAVDDAIASENDYYIDLSEDKISLLPGGEIKRSYQLIIDVLRARLAVEAVEDNINQEGVN